MKKQNKIELLALFIILIIFIATRLNTLKFVFAFPEIRLMGPDSFYHLKRIIYNLENYPEMLTFDPFLSYPDGDLVPWPSLFDFIGGTIAKIFGDPIYPSLFLNFIFALGCLSIILIRQLKKDLISAITTTAILAVSITSLTNESVGSVDHHTLEVFLVISFYLVLESSSNSVFKKILLSLIVTLSFLNWPGAPLYYGPLFIFLLIKAYRKSIEINDLLNITIPFLISGIVIFIYLDGFKNDFFNYSFRFLSNFQRDFCFFISISSFVLVLYKKRIISGLLSVFALVGTTFIFNRLFIEVLYGLGYLGKTADSKLMIVVQESQPIFFGINRFFYDDFVRNLSNFTPFYLLTPFLIYREIKKSRLNIIFYAFIYFFLLTVFQIRFGIFFVPFLSIYIGDWAYDFKSKSGLKFIKFIIPPSALLYSLFMFIKILTMSYDYYNFGSHNLYNTMNFLREKTYYKDKFSEGISTYGIFCGWEIGHYVVTLGNRPATAHNFITNAKNNKELAYIKAVFSKDEKEIVDMMDLYKTRYLVIANLQSYVVMNWNLISDTDNPYITKGERQIYINDNINELFLYKLAFLAYPAKNLRIVYESKSNKISDYFAIIERVKGVKLISEEKGVVFVKLITINGEIDIVFEPEYSNGKYVFNIPYSNEKLYDAYVDAIYFKSNKGIKPIIIKESEVIDGIEKFLN